MKERKSTRPAHRPPVYRADFHPEKFVELSGMGKSIVQIAAAWDVTRDCLYKWAQEHKEFLYAMKKGRERLEAWYSEIALEGMEKKRPVDVGLFVWMSKNVLRWSDVVEQVELDHDQHEETKGFKMIEPDEK